MSPLFSYALKSLYKNKTRTIVTIIGVIMSAALLVALAVFGTSLYNYAIEGYSYENGDWHIGIANAPKQDVQTISADIAMENPVMAKSIGYAKVETSVGGKPYLYLHGVGQDYYKHMPVHVTEGHLPEHEGEILLPESFRLQTALLQNDTQQSDAQQNDITHNDKNEISAMMSSNGWQVGSKVKLAVGLRLKDGIALWQHVPYGSSIDEFGVIFSNNDKEETLQELQYQEYTIAGFYEDINSGNSRNTLSKSDVPGYEAFVWWNGEMTEDSYNRYSLWFQIPDVGNNVFHEVYGKLRLFYDYNGLQLPVNLNLLSFYGVQISQTGESAAAVAVVVILLLIILVGSVMLIYNAFAISVGERTKQFGLLSSIGATKKQVRRSVICEAAIVSGIGTLLGVFTGIGLVAVVLEAMGEMVADLMEFSLKPHLHVWIPAVLLAMVLAVLTVLISAWIPAKRATKVTAIEAIRQNRDIRYSGKQKKIPAFVEKLFGYEGALAVIYSGRNRRRYRVITIALFLSMVLFVSINAFSDYMMTVIETEYKTSNYDILVQIPSLDYFGANESASFYGNRDKSIQKILNTLRGIEGVDSVVQTIYLNYRMPVEENAEHVTKNFKNVLEDYSSTAGRTAAAISVVDNESFSAFCKEHELEESLFLDVENLKVIVNNHFKATDGKTGNTKLIDGLVEKDGVFYVDLSADYYMENYQKKITEFRAGYYAESLAPGCNDNWHLTIMLPESAAGALGLQDMSDNSITFCLTTSDHRKVAEETETILKAQYPDCIIFDQAERQAGNRNLVFMLRLLSNGFIVMITVISMANVFSTISSSLKLRQKEFAMLKTVGMTAQGLQRMMNLECLMYGGKAVLFGLPVSILAAAIMYYYFHQDVIFDFFLPVQSIFIAIGSIFGVVFVTMLYTMGRMKKENVIDVLKQESF